MALITSNADFAWLLKTDTFTFLVGSEEQPFNIHAGLMRGLSDPLDSLMNNGCMSESLEREATLYDVDPQTFILFIQFAYTGLYRAPPKIPRSKEFCHCRSCGRLDVDREGNNWPFCGRCPKEEDDRHGSDNKTWYCIECATACVLEHGQRVCDVCSSKLKALSTSKPRTQKLDGDIRKAASDQAWSMFMMKRFPVGAMLPKEFRKTLNVTGAAVGSTDDLIVHAKLWVLASNYLVARLEQMALHLLHRDLSMFSINSFNISGFVDLVAYTYEHTTRESRTSRGCGEQLRDLVVEYVVLKARELDQYEEFKVLLMNGGEFVVEFVSKLMQHTVVEEEE